MSCHCQLPHRNWPCHACLSTVSHCAAEPLAVYLEPLDLTDRYLLTQTLGNLQQAREPTYVLAVNTMITLPRTRIVRLRVHSDHRQSESES